VTEFFSPSVFGSWVFVGVHSSREDLNQVAWSRKKAEEAI
jgi:hypothetical protein